jgi:hypothetical protein
VSTSGRPTARDRNREELYVPRNDHRCRWSSALAATSKRRIFADNGEPQVLGVAADITARRQAEIQLRERTERLIRFQEIIHELALQDEPDQERAIDRILESAGPAMDVARICVWRFVEEQQRFEMLRTWHQGALSSPSTCLEVADNTEHLRALAASRVLAISDLATDPLTLEAYERQLRPLGLRALLTCHCAHKGDSRAWCALRRRTPRVDTRRTGLRRLDRGFRGAGPGLSPPAQPGGAAATVAEDGGGRRPGRRRRA